MLPLPSEMGTLVEATESRPGLSSVSLSADTAQTQQPLKCPPLPTPPQESGIYVRCLSRWRVINKYANTNDIFCDYCNQPHMGHCTIIISPTGRTPHCHIVSIFCTSANSFQCSWTTYTGLSCTHRNGVSIVDHKTENPVTLPVHLRIERDSLSGKIRIPLDKLLHL